MRAAGFALWLLGSLAAARCLQAQEPQQEILNLIGNFEGKHDPKCYATASRLEDFMYGTPLTDDARVLKNRLMIRFVEMLWKSASESSEKLVGLALLQEADRQARQSERACDFGRANPRSVGALFRSSTRGNSSR